MPAPVSRRTSCGRCSNPIYPQGGIAVLQGNLAPGGAIIKQSAADAALMEHEGRAVVFENAEDLALRIDDPELDVDADDVLVLKNIGPKGAPGMPEAGYMPIPLQARARRREGHRAHLRRPHERHRVRHHRAARDARGRRRRAARACSQRRPHPPFSVAQRELTLLVPTMSSQRRAAANPITAPTAERGYRKLFLQAVTQADQGVDFDFLRAARCAARRRITRTEKA